MAFNDEPPMVYTQAAETGRLFDEPTVVTRFTLTYDPLGGAALSPGASLALIEQAAEEYEDAHRTRPEDRDVAQEQL